MSCKNNRVHNPSRVVTLSNEKREYETFHEDCALKKFWNVIKFSILMPICILYIQ